MLVILFSIFPVIRPVLTYFTPCVFNGLFKATGGTLFSPLENFPGFFIYRRTIRLFLLCRQQVFLSLFPPFIKIRLSKDGIFGLADTYPGFEVFFPYLAVI